MNQRDTSSEPLPNAQHEAFAREIAYGRNATQAYLNVYGTKNCPSGSDRPSGPDRRAAATGGSRLLRRKPIADRIKAIQEAGAAGVALELREIHAFLARVVRTPAGHVTPASDLCTRVKHTRDGHIDVSMPDKLAAIRLDAKLQGFFDPNHPARNPHPPDQPAPGGPPVLTEERRAVLMAKRRKFVLAQIKADEEARLAEQQRQPSPPEAPTDAPRPPEPVETPELRTPNSEPRTANSEPRTPISGLRTPRPPLRTRRGPINSGSFPYFGMNFERRPAPTANPNHIVRSPIPVPPAESGPDHPASGNVQPASPPIRVTRETSPKNVNNSHHPPAPTPDPQPSDVDLAAARDRMSREAAHRARLTGDPTTSDALLVI
jgi:hypothetical protein